MSHEITWTDLKAFLSARNIVCQYIELPNEYYIYGIDGPHKVYTRLDRDPTDTADLTDFETNYKPTANTSFTDSNGIPLSRGKVTQTGWHYQEQGIEITTADQDNYYNKDKDGNDLGFITYTMKDSNGDVTTTNANAVETIVKWTPAYDFEIIGSQFYQSTSPTNNVRMYVTAAPDYTPAQGGSIPFVEGGINLKHLGVGNILTVDGRSAKKVSYFNAGLGYLNTFELKFKHDAGDQNTVQVIVEIFKP